MTELEKKIYECALRVLPDAKKRVKEIKTKVRYIEIPFYCDGCFNFLIYDKNVKMFTKILYIKGKGTGTSIEGISEFTAYFDEVEHCKIDIKL